MEGSLNEGTGLKVDPLHAVRKVCRVLVRHPVGTGLEVHNVGIDGIQVGDLTRGHVGNRSVGLGGDGCRIDARGPGLSKEQHGVLRLGPNVFVAFSTLKGEPTLVAVNIHEFGGKLYGQTVAFVILRNVQTHSLVVQQLLFNVCLCRANSYLVDIA